MERSATKRPPGLGAWRFVLGFGVVSLLMDMVYEGARSVTGPLLASLGASALAVGIITGTGESAALVLRLVSGPMADRTRSFWGFAIAGYALTVVTVPFLGLAGAVWVAAVLIILERAAKAVRSPAKDTMISHATAVTSRGKGFAVHEAIDQFGAVLGPLIVAGVLALTGGGYGPSLAVLAVPGIIAMTVLLWLRSRVPHPELYEAPRPGDTRKADAPPGPAPPLGRFWGYALFTGLTMAGFATFGVLSFHMVERGIMSVAWVPALYAAAMGADALARVGHGMAL